MPRVRKIHLRQRQCQCRTYDIEVQPSIESRFLFDGLHRSLTHISLTSITLPRPYERRLDDSSVLRSLVFRGSPGVGPILNDFHEPHFRHLGLSCSRDIDLVSFLERSGGLKSLELDDISRISKHDQAENMGLRRVFAGNCKN